MKLIAKKRKFAIREPMKPAQLAGVEHILNNPGTLLNYKVGLGKSRTSIEAANRLNMPVTVTAPASLIGNYKAELAKWGNPDLLSRIKFISHQRVARNGLGSYDPVGGVLLSDEQQQARNFKSKLLKSLKQTQSSKRVALSGTPIFNSPSEISPTINFLAGKNVLPEKPSEFDQKYVAEEKVNPGLFARLMGVHPGVVKKLINQKELADIMRPYVVSADAETSGYPSTTQENVHVQMAPKQTQLYNAVMGRANWIDRYRVTHNLPPNKGSDLKRMNSFLSAARQISNTTEGFTTRKQDIESPKLNSAFNYLQKQIQKNPRYKALIYSNYLKSGLDPYKKLLDTSKIPYGEFSGQVPSNERDRLVQEYNTGKLKALLVSGAGTQGLNTKNTRLIQLLDPNFSEQKNKQIIGRGVRYKSHEGLPTNEQTVNVQRYFSDPPNSWWNKYISGGQTGGSDQYIHSLATRKDLLNDQLYALMAGLNRAK